MVPGFVSPTARGSTARSPRYVSAVSHVLLFEKYSFVVDATAGHPPWFFVVSESEFSESLIGSIRILNYSNLQLCEFLRLTGRITIFFKKKIKSFSLANFNIFKVCFIKSAVPCNKYISNGEGMRSYNKITEYAMS